MSIARAIGLPIDGQVLKINSELFFEIISNLGIDTEAHGAAVGSVADTVIVIIY